MPHIYFLTSQALWINIASKYMCVYIHAHTIHVYVHTYVPIDIYLHMCIHIYIRYSTPWVQNNSTTKLVPVFSISLFSTIWSLSPFIFIIPIYHSVLQKGSSFPLSHPATNLHVDALFTSPSHTPCILLHTQLWPQYPPVVLLLPPLYPTRMLPPPHAEA